VSDIQSVASQLVKDALVRPVHESFAMQDPWSVILFRPALAELILNIALDNATSEVNASVKVPMCNADVNIMRRLLITTCDE
jgi:hypothetical protein